MIAPARIRRGPPAPRGRAVDDVVMNQRGAVQQLDHRCQTDRSLAPPAGVRVAKKQKRGTQPLPPAAEKIAGNFRNRLERNRALPRKFFLDKHEVVSHQIKNLFGCEQRDSLPPWDRRHLGDSAAADNDGSERRKNRRKFPAVLAANSSAAKSLTLASVRATSATYAGSFRFPRNGLGARYGQSVSIDRKSTRLNSSHPSISYAVFCL